jgi:hypothetical protein
MIGGGRSPVPGFASKDEKRGTWIGAPAAGAERRGAANSPRWAMGARAGGKGGDPSRLGIGVGGAEGLGRKIIDKDP